MVAEAGAGVQGSMEGLEPAFSTCSGARSSTDCCRRWAASAWKDGSIFGDPVPLSAEWRTCAEPTRRRDETKPRAVSVPRRSGRRSPATPGLPLSGAKMASGGIPANKVEIIGSQPARPPDDAECGRTAPRFTPRRARHPALGADETSQWAERSARLRVRRV